MKYLRLITMLTTCLTLCVIAACHAGEPLDAEAIEQAKPKFLEKFVPAGQYFILMIKDPRKGLVQFKDVSSSAVADTLSEADKMNGVTWRGRVTYGAKFMRFFPDDPAHPNQNGDMQAGDWQATSSMFGRTLFISTVEQKRGKWTVDTDRVDDFARPTDDQLKRLDATLKKLQE